MCLICHTYVSNLHQTILGMSHIHTSQTTLHHSIECSSFNESIQGLSPQLRINPNSITENVVIIKQPKTSNQYSNNQRPTLNLCRMSSETILYFTHCRRKLFRMLSKKCFIACSNNMLHYIPRMSRHLAYSLLIGVHYRDLITSN